jgi:hypothetical protein
LFQPAVDSGPVALSACGFLTASLGSIHDASAAGEERSRKAPGRSKASAKPLASRWTNPHVERR